MQTLIRYEMRSTGHNSQTRSIYIIIVYSLSSSLSQL